jgi:diguanylate cyclase (GGDEF)-like protein
MDNNRLLELLQWKNPDSKMPFFACCEDELGKNISLTSILSCHNRFNVVLFRIHDYYLLKELYGDELVRCLDGLIARAIGNLTFNYGNLHKDAFVLSLTSGEHLLLYNDKLSSLAIHDTAYSFRLKVLNVLRQEAITLTGRDIGLDVGYAMFEAGNGNGGFEKIFFESVVRAREMSLKRFDLENLNIAQELHQAICQENIQTLFQPIFDFSNGSIMAWEALSRGPRDSCLYSPSVLFDFAEQVGELFSLENVCREKAIQRIGSLQKGKKLFLNIHPRTLVDPKFTPGRTLDLLEKVGLRPENVVFEITERHSIKDFKLFHLTLEHYRTQGFQVAIDDAGTGYSGLSSIATLQPEYIKIDMGLVRDVHKDPVKQALLETFVAFATRIGAKVIAEGIEKKSEAMRLVELGMHYGQGFYLGKPVFPKADSPIDITRLSLVRPSTFDRLSCSIPVGLLAAPVVKVSPNMEVHEVQKMFKQDTTLTGIVVCQDQTPTGLVMDYSLDRKLAAPYGHALYSRRNIETIMDADVLIVDASSPVEDVAKRAMARGKMKAYDEIIVTQDGTLLGSVSVQKLLNTLAEVQVEMAKGSNPLSGLPGNIALEKALEERLQNGRPFSLMYADLDNFKVYNDTYGFSEGDKILLLISKILKKVLEKRGTVRDALYHVGGDDFVLISQPERVMTLAETVAKCFGRLTRSCYSKEDREHGWIIGKDRDGKTCKFPLVSVSLGILDCYDYCTMRELSEQAAAIKKYAKSIPGNSYVRDRRERK